MPAPRSAAFPWLLAYFRQTYPHRVEQTEQGVELVPLTDRPLFSEALHYAYSFDGFHWTALNGNEPVFTVSTRSGVLRDPFLRRETDGLFHLVGTAGVEEPTIVYTRSSDLMRWEETCL